MPSKHPNQSYPSSFIFISHVCGPYPPWCPQEVTSPMGRKPASSQCWQILRTWQGLLITIFCPSWVPLEESCSVFFSPLWHPITDVYSLYWSQPHLCIWRRKEGMKCDLSPHPATLAHGNLSLVNPQSPKLLWDYTLPNPVGAQTPPV